MLELTTKELLALQFVFEFISVKDVLVSAMNCFAEDSTERSKDNADVCFKAVQTYLK